MATQTKPIELHYWPTPNGWKITIMLEELGVPFVGGGALAIFAMTAMAISQKEQERAGAQAPPPRDSVAASILAQILVAGGANDEDALRDIRREAGLGAPITRGVDVTNWAEAYARVSDRASSVRCCSRPRCSSSPDETRPIPLRQYAALLDLSFGLGFHTDALARLRETYGFDVRRSREGRAPARSGSRRRRHAAFRPRRRGAPRSFCGVLGLDVTANRQEIIAAYRSSWRSIIPIGSTGRPSEVQSAAAARFIEHHPGLRRRC